MHDIVILFGAGASYGSGGILPESPPLGNQLFNILCKYFPGSWGSLPFETAYAFNKGFEAGMAIVYNKMGGYISQLMRDMAIYFIQFRPINGTSLYCRLIRDLEKHDLIKHTAFSTLNYECVLEYSLLQYGHQIHYDESANPLSIPVWKLHGSCNMSSANLDAKGGVFYGTGVHFEGGIKATLDSNKVIEDWLVGTDLAPVMSLYMQGKPLNVSGNSIKAIQSIWSNAISNAKIVVAIGVQPWPEDCHIWGPIAATQATFLCIGDEKAYAKWRSSSRSSPTEILGSRFNTSYNKLISRINSLCS